MNKSTSLPLLRPSTNDRRLNSGGRGGDFRATDSRASTRSGGSADSHRQICMKNDLLNKRMSLLKLATALHMSYTSVQKATSVNILRTITLRVIVREAEYKVNCGGGNQSILWLANFVRNRYSTLHPQYRTMQFTPIHVADHENSAAFPNELIKDRFRFGDLVYVTLIGPHRGLTHPRKKTLWEQMAFTPQERFVDVVIELDLDQEEMSEEMREKGPSVMGNFNSWKYFIPMERQGEKETKKEGEPEDREEELTEFYRTHKPNNKENPQQKTVEFREGLIEGPSVSAADTTKETQKPEQEKETDNKKTEERDDKNPDVPEKERPAVSTSAEKGWTKTETRKVRRSFLPPPKKKASRLFVHKLRLPPNAEVTMKFFIGGRGFLTRSLEIVEDDRGDQMNYLQVKQFSKSVKAYKAGAQYRTGNTATRTITIANPSIYFHKGPLPEKVKKTKFSSDKERIRITDVVDDPHERALVFQLLEKNFTEIKSTFKFYSSQASTHELAYMNVLKFQSFCRRAGLSNKELNASRIAEVHSVVDQYEVNQKFKQKNRRTVQKKSENPNNPDAAFIRCEFLEAFVRIALIRRPDLRPSKAVAEAIRISMEKHPVKHANLVRDQLLAQGPQQVYEHYGDRLFKMFKHYSSRDGGIKAKFITVMGFEAMLKNANIFNDDYSVMMAKAAFALSQEEDDEADDDYEAYMQMTYSEFLEALARVAADRFAQTGIALQEKLLVLFTHMFDTRMKNPHAKLKDPSKFKPVRAH